MLKDELHSWVMDNFKNIVDVALEYDIVDKWFWYESDSKSGERVVYWKRSTSLSLPRITLKKQNPLADLEEEGLLEVRHEKLNNYYRIKPRGIHAVKADFEYPTLLEELASSIHSAAQPKMSTLPLTDKQKELIRSLGPYLKSGDIETTWTLQYGDDKITAIHGLDKNGELLRSHWKHATEADFAAFVDCKFLTIAGYNNNLGLPNRYHLNQARIEQAIEQDFRAESSTGNTNINVNVDGDISGHVNVAGRDINQATQDGEKAD